MKKHIPFLILILLVIIFALSSKAKVVDSNTVKNVAINLYNERADDPSQNISIINIIEEKQDGITLYYIVEFAPTGYAIISADDRAYPVLVYSTNSNYDPTEIPDGARWLLENYKKQIMYLIEQNINPSEKTVNKWEHYKKIPDNSSKDPVDNVLPLLSSTWGQGLYFNSLCPEDPGDTVSGHVPVGCGATAMAQVLNYWQNPWKGNGYHSYDHSEYGLLEANFDTTIYNYDNMPDIVNAENIDVATLSYHCAVSCDMDFAPDGSGSLLTKIEDALRDHFYINDNVDAKDRAGYWGDLWDNMLKEELDLKMPIIYSGVDLAELSGHIWVVDGYEGEDHYHINWGWYGSWDNYYYLDNLIPNGAHYWFAHWAVFHVRPEINNLNGTLSVANSPYHYKTNLNVLPSDVLTIEPGTEIIFEGRYHLQIQGQLLATGTQSDSIYFTAENPAVGWQGVRFTNLNNISVDSSKLEYCSFNRGKGEFTVVNAYGGTKGGAVYCENSSGVLISNSLIRNSQADYGGGIACYDTSNIRIRNCLIRNDNATMGGGLYFSNSNPVLSQNIIEDNISLTSTGGGVFCNHSDATFYQDTIRNNTGKFGAGVGAAYSWAIFDQVIFHNNHAIVDGGAMYLSQSNLSVTNSEIYENAATNLAGGVLCYWDSDANFNQVLIHHNSSDSASAIYVLDAHPTFTNATITDNFSNPSGQGILIDEGAVTIKNSIVWNTGPDPIDTAGSCNVSINYSIIDDLNWQGTGIKHFDPLFADPDISNYRLTWEDYPLPDGNKSPAIDAGNPSSPADPDGTTTDLGAIPYDQVYTSIPGGNINGTLTCAGSPYFVQGDIILPATDQLVIEPCVAVIFQGYYRFEVRGQLLAEGTETERITFAPADTIEGWRGLRFINTKTNGQDSSKLINCRITFGNAHDSYGDYYRGGAIYSKSSGDILVKNCLLNKNQAEQSGGAIYSSGSGGPFYIGNVFENNYAPTGGAMYANSAGNFYFRDNLFQNNRANNGGALSAYSSNIYLAGNTIRENRAEQFGGAVYYASGGNFFFDDTDKNQVYLNYAGAAGLDFYYAGYQSSTSVIVDTFTVSNPHKHFAYPISKFNFAIENAIIPQIASDLYVSMSGSDDNTGTSSSEPLKTMYMACMKILADELNPRTIYLDAGTYSQGATGEVFPINWRSYVNMQGQGAEETTIYGEDKNQLLYCYSDSGFTIDSIDFEGGYGEYGGGIRLENYSSPLLSNLEVKLNYATEEGGGIYCANYCNPVLENVRINNDSSINGGGGIAFYNYCNAMMINCRIENNYTTYGGGGAKIKFYSDVTIDSCVIFHNTAVNGGGLYIDWDSDAIIKNTTIQANDALTHVAGYSGTGGGIWSSYYSDPVLENVEILFNHADAIGGGIFSQTQSHASVINCWIEHNSANRGGGLYLNSSADQHYYNTVIASNSTNDNHGGGIYLSGNNSVFTNVTVTENHIGDPGEGGGLYNSNGNPVFTNSVFWNNSPTEIVSSGGVVVAEYCDIEGGYSGTGNINSNPQFIPYYGQYDIAETSPCVNAGKADTTGMNLPELDLGGNPRISNNRVDMGAYEYQFPQTHVLVDLKVFLEGPYDAVSHFMSTNLNTGNHIPTGQPYNPPLPYYGEDAPVWLYDGGESVPSVPVDVVDWVLVQLRDADLPENATSATIIGEQAGFLLNDGTITGPDGTGNLSFPATITQNLYVVIFQRNHLGIMSNYHLIESGGIYSYDFTIGENQVYGGINGHKLLEPGIWGMIAGDGNGNGIIQNTDETAVWKIDLGQSGYKGGDFDLNGIVQNTDETNIWKVNLGSGGQTPSKTTTEGYRSQVPE
ncbi:MAG TPA: C10 family peptidase [Bacteroidales bacterium]|nr:C10 family peptidase [Bacteroidales bacterium]